MEPIDIAAIERHARQLRAQEIQRLEGLFVERAKVYGLLLGNSVLSLLETVGEVIRPLFSWNPQERTRRPAGSAFLARINDGVRTLFSWNPRKHHSA